MPPIKIYKQALKVGSCSNGDKFVQLFFGFFVLSCVVLK